MAKKSKLPDWMSELGELDADAAEDFAHENGLIGEDDGETGADTNQDADDDQDTDETEETDESGDDAADDADDDQDDDQSGEDSEDESAADDKSDEDPEEPRATPDAEKDKGKGKAKQVPYEALHEERKKRQELQRRLEALESRVNQPNAQQTDQQTGQQNEQQTEQQQKEQANAYVEWMESEAEKQFKAQFGYAPNERISARAKEAFKEKFGRDPDKFDDDDGEALDDIKADLIKRDTSRLASISTQIGQHVQTQLQSRQTEQQQRKKMNSDYLTNFKAKPDAQQIFDYANQRYGKLAESEKAVLGPAAERVGKGTGSADDIFAFKTFMDLSEMEWRQQSGKAPDAQTQTEEQKPKTQPKKKSTSQKVDELQKQPRSAMIGGNGDSIGTNSIAEADRIMQNEPYEKWPKWMKRMFEGG